MTDAEAETAFCKIRWVETAGEPVCPHCGGLDAYLNPRPNGWCCPNGQRLRTPGAT